MAATSSWVRIPRPPPHRPPPHRTPHSALPAPPSAAPRSVAPPGAARAPPHRPARAPGRRLFDAGSTRTRVAVPGSPRGPDLARPPDHEAGVDDDVPRRARVAVDPGEQP